MFINVFLLCWVSTSFAKSPKKKSPTPRGVDSKLVYIELHPEEQLQYEISWLKSCKEDKLNIKKFESLKSYPSTNKSGNETVRVLHFYIDPFSPCSKTPNIKGKQVLSIEGDKAKMTHIYLVLHKDLGL